MFGLNTGVWMVGGGIVLLAVSLVIVNRYDLSRRGPMTALAGGAEKRLPTAIAVVCGLAGGALIFLGTRAG